MVEFKSFNNLVLDVLDRLRLTQPNLDTKPNTVARDLFIDSQSFQLANLYETAREISALQSIANLTGQDLINYGANFGLEKRTGTRSIGTVVFTFRSIDSDLTIPANTVVRTRGGIPFLTVSAQTINTSQINSLRATATRLRQQLDTAGITDEFAIEVSVEAQSPGSSGNVAAFSIISHSAASVNSVTNVSSFTGGTNVETDAAFRARILAVFAGTNVGTALGYRSAVLELAETIDALVVEPDDTLMTRDGTIVGTDDNGDPIITEAGTGGKVDIYVLGNNLQSGTDSFVYNDNSGSGNPTDSSNDFVLGQGALSADTSLTLNSRRVATLSNGATIPNQPVSTLVSVSGSSSGPNFVEEFLDDAGNTQGNFKLVKDTGAAAGSPFGLDKLVWISDRISLPDQSRTKGELNSIDELPFLDVLEISAINQDVQITNENSSTSSSREYITTKHTPVRTVSRVFNLTTGERYTILDQNPDGGDLNTTGRVQISGNTLPTASDVLQVDYIWVYSFAPQVDFDNLSPKDDLNEAQDSVEWGFTNYVRDELSTAVLDAYNNLQVRTDFNISRVLSVNTFVSETLVVSGSANDKTIQTSNSISNIFKITDTSLDGEPEVFNTLEGDGTFSNLLISLPSDTLAELGDSVEVIYNLEDIFDLDGYDPGTFLNNIITLNPSTATTSGTAVRVNYVMDFLNILDNTDISALPISSDSLNSFDGLDGYQPFINEFSGTTVISNKRRSPSNLRVNVSNIPNQGTLRFSGATFNKIETTYTATSGTVDLAELIRSAEGLSATATVPSNIYVAKVINLEKVALTSSGLVSSVELEYDLTNYGIKNSRWDRENAIEISTLANTKVELADTELNTDNPITTGTHIRATFYYAKQNDYEDLFYSRNGTMITNKRFAHIASINRISGFQDSGGTTSGKFKINSFNQPVQNSSYSVDFDYTAPKENERITINYEFNKLIVDATEVVEDKRPITADVLVKGAVEVSLDVDALIVVSSDFEDREATVKQDVADNIAATLTATALETTLDSSDIIDNAYNVEGLDRIRILRFNKENISGTKLSISAGKNEYLSAGNITVEVESR